MNTDCYCAALRLAARKVSAIYDAALAPADVNVAQFGLLRRVAKLGPVSLTELGLQSGLDRSTVGRNIKVLERRSLIDAVPSDDGREACVRLAPDGARVLKTAEPLWLSAQRELETVLGPGAAQLKRLLSEF